MSTVEDGDNRDESTEQQTINAPFEGPEKLLEIWFRAPDGDQDGQERSGLRAVSREKWEEMLDIVRCKVLSVIRGKELDAYLLRYGPPNTARALTSAFYLVNLRCLSIPTKLFSRRVAPPSICSASLGYWRLRTRNAD